MQICCFVISLGKAKRQGSLVVANATGTGPSWHATKQKDAWGGVRGGTPSVCSKAAQPSDACTLQLNLDPKIQSQSCLGFEEVVSVLIFSVKSICKQMTKGHVVVAKNWHTCVWHTPHVSFPSVSPISSPLLPSSSLHHLAPSCSARLLTTCASAGRALAPGLIVHW